MNIGEKVRDDFPALSRTIHGKPLIYLDSAATALKPKPVIEATRAYYAENSANVHRGVHTLSQLATDAFESTREKVRAFVNAREEAEIIFTKGCTEAINLVAQSYARTFLKAGDEIVITTMEHHSNIVPWQILCEQIGTVLRVAPINDDGEVILEEYEQLLSEKTKIVALVHISNSIGTINPAKQMIAMAKKHGAICLVDGAQGGPHLQINVQDIDADFYTLSCHKIYGPTGTGILYGKRTLLEKMPPYQSGGSMIRTVSFEKTTYAEIPAKFEPGTPNIAGFIGLGAAIDYVQSIGKEAIASYEHELLAYGTQLLSDIPGLTIRGQAREKAGILAFTLEGVHPHDLGTVLDAEGIAIRAGHHCTMPLMKRMGVPATARASLGMYTMKSDLDALQRAVRKAKEILG
ncbi:MAG: cysteine desulfurase [Fimbriimonadaceae bacterium]|nr:cysteine desulfurase [Fimbriimonadaceae bacterium]